MTQFRRPNPYDARYALPPEVYAEPPGNNARVTAWRPRGSYDQAPDGWDGGYTLPAYVRAERPGGGAAFTHWPARGTIPQHLPNALSGLGDLSVPAPGFRGDPIKRYGQSVARDLLRSLRREVPEPWQGTALYALLDHIDPGLSGKVKERASLYRSKFGMGPDTAQERAIASAMSEGLLHEVGNMGQGKQPKKQSQVGLGWYDDGVQVSLDGWLSKVGSAFKKVGSTVKGAAVKVGSGVKYGAKTAYKWGKKGIQKVGKYACKAINSDLFKTAAAAGGVAAGIPPQATMAGAEAAGGMCPKGQVPVETPMPTPAPSGSPSWLVPALLGGAGLLVLAMR